MNRDSFRVDFIINIEKGDWFLIFKRFLIFFFIDYVSIICFYGFIYFISFKIGVENKN